jgi:hypothetical protein
MYGLLTTKFNRMEKTIYELKLHESTKIEGEDIRIVRVHKGWLYQMRSDYGWVQTFVPFEGEFNND